MTLMTAILLVASLATVMALWGLADRDPDAALLGACAHTFWLCYGIAEGRPVHVLALSVVFAGLYLRMAVRWRSERGDRPLRPLALLRSFFFGSPRRAS